MTDSLHRAICSQDKVLLAVATTTSTLAEVTELQTLKSGSKLALGRALSATALVGLVQNDRTSMSVQWVGDGPLGQVFVDVTAEGNLRGYVKETSVKKIESENYRSHLAPLMGRGSISTIRMFPNNQFTQSNTDMLDGELDADLAKHIEQSNQVPTALFCDVVPDPIKGIDISGGILVQAMPGTDLSRMNSIVEKLTNGGWADLLIGYGDNWLALLGQLAPDAEPLRDGNLNLRWQCRCSRERVLSALAMFGPIDLAEMVSEKEAPKMTCEFCGKIYHITESEVAAAYHSKVKKVDN